MKKMILVFLGMTALSSVRIAALEIDLSGTGLKGKPSANVGVVDMEEVYAEFPETRRAKEDFAQKVLERKNEVKKREAEVTKLKGEIAVLKNLLTVSSTTQAVSPSQGDSGASAVADKQKQLAEMEQDLKIYKGDSQRVLLQFESVKTQTLLGKVYKVIEEVAEEEQATLVIDKNAALYGQPSIDLTEKVIAKLKE